jgi:hypothetical protein
MVCDACGARVAPCVLSAHCMRRIWCVVRYPNGEPLRIACLHCEFALCVCGLRVGLGARCVPCEARRCVLWVLCVRSVRTMRCPCLGLRMTCSGCRAVLCVWSVRTMRAEALRALGALCVVSTHHALCVSGTAHNVQWVSGDARCAIRARIACRLSCVPSRALTERRLGLRASYASYARCA